MYGRMYAFQKCIHTLQMILSKNRNILPGFPVSKGHKLLC